MPDNIIVQDTIQNVYVNNIGAPGPAGFSAVLPWRSGNYYRAPITSVNTTTTAVANTTYYTPIWVPSSVTVDRLSFITGNAFSGTASVRLGIYADDGTGVPSTLLLDAGAWNPTTAAQTVVTSAFSLSLTAGLYWLAFNSQTAATTNTYYGVSAASYTLGTSSATLTSNTVSYQQTGVTGAFANAGTLTTGTIAPIVSVRRA